MKLKGSNICKSLTATNVEGVLFGCLLAMLWMVKWGGGGERIDDGYQRGKIVYQFSISESNVFMHSGNIFKRVHQNLLIGLKRPRCR